MLQYEIAYTRSIVCVKIVAFWGLTHSLSAYVNLCCERQTTRNRNHSSIQSASLELRKALIR